MKVRHKKRGTTYQVLFGTATLQVEGELDNERVVVYQGIDGKVWVRPHAEFFDGRFEEVHDV